MSTGAGTCCLDCRLESGPRCGYKEPTTCTDPKKMACPSAAPKNVNPDDLKLWPKDDRRRILHAVYRIGDMEKTMKWMQDCLGMQILRKRDVPEEKYMNVFMGYGSEDNHFAAELTYNYGVSKYDLGAAFGHFGISVPNAYGMKLIARRDFPALKKTMAYVAYDLDETRGTVVEFEYNYGKTDYAKGTGYAQLAIGTEDVFKTASACELGGGKTVRAPGPLPKIGTKIYGVNDPDGWKTVWVDNSDFVKELEPSTFVHEVHCTTDNQRQHA